VRWSAAEDSQILPKWPRNSGPRWVDAWRAGCRSYPMRGASSRVSPRSSGFRWASTTSTMSIPRRTSTTTPACSPTGPGVPRVARRGRDLQGRREGRPEDADRRPRDAEAHDNASFGRRASHALAPGSVPLGRLAPPSARSLRRRRHSGARIAMRSASMRSPPKRNPSRSRPSSTNPSAS